MIVWLAGYPRSGNNLLRAMLRHCLGLYSYRERASWETPEEAKKAELLGDLGSDLPWPIFYQRARHSSETFLIKTHDWPRDGEPAICLVRDPRITLTSYLKFHQANGTLRESEGLLSLILGDDYYGSWSDFYEAWRKRQENVLFLKYDQLLTDPDGALADVAALTGRAMPSKPWAEQLERLRAMDSVDTRFLRSGFQTWERPEEWNDRIDALFCRVHGAMSETLGIGELKRADPQGGKDGDEEKWVHLASDLAKAAHAWRMQAIFKEETIQRLLCR